MSTYKAVTRKYVDYDGKTGIARFIARGQMADGHLAYSRVDENNDCIDDEECCWIQIRGYNGLIMSRI